VQFRGLYLATFCLALSAPALAVVWPTAVQKVEKELVAEDVQVRRRAAQRLRELPLAAARRLADRALDDPDVEVRLTALETALAIDVPGVGGRVAVWLTDSERRLRHAAAEALGVSPTPRAVPALARALSDSDPGVRSAAAGALGASENPDAALALLGRLDDSVPEVRQNVALALARLGDARAVLPLIGKIEDSRPGVRRSVARALGDLRDARAVSALVLVLRDTDESVRIAALDALGNVGDASATSSIAALLSGEVTSAQRTAAVDALAKIGSAESLSALIKELERDEPGRERATVLRALSKVGPSASEALKKCLAAPLTPVQADGCALGLGEVGGAGVGNTVREALRRGAVRPQAGLWALAQLGEREALPSILEYLSDADPLVRRAAIDAAAALLDPRVPDGRAVEPIQRALRKARSNRTELILLMSLLGRTGAPRAALELAPYTRAKADPELASAALEALGLLGPSGQEMLLLDGLKSDIGWVRLAAGLALWRAAPAKIAPTLLDRLERSAEEDRAALSLALSGALSRNSDEAVQNRVERALLHSRGAERDAFIEAMGRMPSKRTMERLAKLASQAADVADRAKYAEALGGHLDAREALLRLARDPDASVRANAVWSLGQIATSADVVTLTKLLADRDVAVAANAAAALGRTSQRLRLPVEKELCGALTDSRSYVRANALSALRIAQQRCSDERVLRLFSREQSEVARGRAAALMREVKPNSSELRALARCASDDASGSVASECALAPQPIPSEVAPSIVYVVPMGEADPVARAPFALVLGDGTMRLGVADRRGVVFEQRAPLGKLSLRVPGPLAE
jgi:HEAT repeat protein